MTVYLVIQVFISLIGRVEEAGYVARSEFKSRLIFQALKSCDDEVLQARDSFDHSVGLILTCLEVPENGREDSPSLSAAT